jgi:hypothetical protein
MAASRKPSNRAIRALIEEVEAGGWSVTPPAGKSNIWKAKCECGIHMEHIHQTPFSPGYAKNKLAKFKRTCWKEENDGRRDGGGAV